MDITNESLKTMKAKQLRRIIREAITEVLAEGTAYQIVGSSGTSVQKLSPEQVKDLQGSSNIKSVKQLEEDGIDEMARVAKGFRLANPEIDSTSFTKTISGVPLSSIVDYFRENPGAEKAQMQAHFGFVRPQIANAIVNGLLDAGVLVKLGAGGEVEATPAPGEEQPEEVTGPEALFIGSGNPLAQYFDDAPNADGSEDFNAEEEPTTAAAGTTPVSTASMSDEDYEAFLTYSKLADRLTATKSNIIKLKRSKGTAVGDIKDKPSTELLRLQDLKKSLEDRINALVASSDYLKKKTGQEETAPEIEDVEDEEPIAEGLDEYTKRKLQFYAGIIK